ncbi:MAG: DUF5717 family protein, partial [Eubacterium sp.]|nr:DUF5717 family protein [Eubacterium sp.]
MKEKMMLLSQGKFVYQEPKVRLSTEKLIFEVSQAGESKKSFVISNTRGTNIKGFCVSPCNSLEFKPVFSGKENEIEVVARAGEHSPGEVIEGEIQIVTDCGETALPMEIRIFANALLPEITSYDDFVELAKRDFSKAAEIFCDNKFIDSYINSYNDKRLYQYLTKKNPKE